MKFFSLLLLIGSLASISHARLGGSVENFSVAQPKESKLQRSVKSSSNANYKVQEMTQEGLAIKEFADLNGVVFAISWRGAIRPSLEKYLGDFYQEYSTASKSQSSQNSPRGQKKSSQVQSSRLVVRREGHMRDWKGFAYVPSLVPAGLNVESLNE